MNCECVHMHSIIPSFPFDDCVILEIKLLNFLMPRLVNCSAPFTQQTKPTLHSPALNKATGKTQTWTNTTCRTSLT